VCCRLYPFILLDNNKEGPGNFSSECIPHWVNHIYLCLYCIVYHLIFISAFIFILLLRDPFFLTYVFFYILVESMLPSHFLYLTMFKGSFTSNQLFYIITNFHPRFIPYSFNPTSYITLWCQFHVDDGGYIMALLR
jgi:hypothetical protein